MRRINHTGRRRITRDRAVLRVVAGGTVLVSIDADVRDLDFEDGAHVVLDISRKVQTERLELGPASRLVSMQNTPIGFDTPHGLTFDLKVVAPEDGLLLGVALGLKPEGESADDVQSILPIRPAPLGQRVWRFDLTESPMLEVNQDLDWNELINRVDFQSLVFPEVLAQVAERVLRSPLIEPGDRLWEWSELLESLGWPVERRPDPDEVGNVGIDDAVDEIVAEFCESHGIAARLKANEDVND